MEVQPVGVAALRTEFTPPAVQPNLFAQLTATARQVAPSPGWDGDGGYSIIDPKAAAQSFGVRPPDARGGSCGVRDKPPRP